MTSNTLIKKYYYLIHLIIVFIKKKWKSSEICSKIWSKEWDLLPKDLNI